MRAGRNAAALGAGFQVVRGDVIDAAAVVDAVPAVLHFLGQADLLALLQADGRGAAGILRPVQPQATRAHGIGKHFPAKFGVGRAVVHVVHRTALRGRRRAVLGIVAVHDGRHGHGGDIAGVDLIDHGRILRRLYLGARAQVRAGRRRAGGVLIHVRAVRPNDDGIGLAADRAGNGGFPYFFFLETVGVLFFDRINGGLLNQQPVIGTVDTLLCSRIAGNQIPSPAFAAHQHGDAFAFKVIFTKQAQSDILAVERQIPGSSPFRIFGSALLDIIGNAVQHQGIPGIVIGFDHIVAGAAERAVGVARRGRQVLLRIPQQVYAQRADVSGIVGVRRVLGLEIAEHGLVVFIDGIHIPVGIVGGGQHVDAGAERYARLIGRNGIGRFVHDGSLIADGDHPGIGDNLVRHRGLVAEAHVGFRGQGGLQVILLALIEHLIPVVAGAAVRQRFFCFGDDGGTARIHARIQPHILFQGHLSDKRRVAVVERGVRDGADAFCAEIVCGAVDGIRQHVAAHIADVIVTVHHQHYVGGFVFQRRIRIQLNRFCFCSVFVPIAASNVHRHRFSLRVGRRLARVVCHVQRRAGDVIGPVLVPGGVPFFGLSSAGVNHLGQRQHRVLRRAHHGAAFDFVVQPEARAGDRIGADRAGILLILIAVQRRRQRRSRRRRAGRRRRRAPGRRGLRVQIRHVRSAHILRPLLLLRNRRFHPLSGDGVVHRLGAGGGIGIGIGVPAVAGTGGRFPTKHPIAKHRAVGRVIVGHGAVALNPRRRRHRRRPDHDENQRQANKADKLLFVHGNTSVIRCGYYTVGSVYYKSMKLSREILQIYVFLLSNPGDFRHVPFISL